MAVPSTSDSTNEEEGEDDEEESVARERKEKVQYKVQSDYEVQSDYGTVPYWQLFAFADPLDYLLMLLGTVGSIANGIAFPVFFLFFGKLIDELGSYSISIGADPDKMQKESNKYVLYFIYLALVALGASYAEVAFWMQTSDRQSLRLREAYLRSLLKQEVGYFDTQTGTGEIISRMWGDAVLVQDAIGEKFGVFLQFLSLFAAGFCVGFSGVWELALITLVVIPALAVAGGSYVYVLSGLNAKAQQAYTGAGQVALQTLSSIRTVYSFVGEDKALDAYSKALEKTLALGVKGGFTKGVNIGVTYAIMFSSWALNFWYAGRLVAKRKATPGEAMTTMFSVLFGGM